MTSDSEAGILDFFVKKGRLKGDTWQRLTDYFEKYNPSPEMQALVVTSKVVHDTAMERNRAEGISFRDANKNLFKTRPGLDKARKYADTKTKSLSNFIKKDIERQKKQTRKDINKFNKASKKLGRNSANTKVNSKVSKKINNVIKGTKKVFSRLVKNIKKRSSKKTRKSKK